MTKTCTDNSKKKIQPSKVKCLKITYKHPLKITDTFGYQFYIDVKRLCQLGQEVAVIHGHERSLRNMDRYFIQKVRKFIGQ